MTFEKRSFQVVSAWLVISCIFISAKNFDFFDSKAVLLILLLGIFSLSHVIGLIANVFVKGKKLHGYNLAVCILITALLLFLVGKIGFKAMGASLWYIPIAWTLWKLGTPKTKQI